MSAGYVLLGVLLVGFYLWYRAGDNSLRLSALKRLTLGIPFFVVMFLLGSLFGAYVLLIFLLDVTLQFLFGRQVFSPGGYTDRLWAWKDRNTRYIMTGDGRPQLIP